MRILDLCCGAGGAGYGYSQAGFEVVGVDISPQPNYPFEFIQADVVHFLAELAPGWLDAVHVSAPCQRWSTKTSDPDKHPDLITPVRPLLENLGLPYVMENVPEAPLLNPIMLCGSSFGLGVRRHRNFETNWPLMGLPCIHEWQLPRYELYDHKKSYLSGIVHVFGTGGGKCKEYWNEAMGIDWMSRREQVEAIPPAYTKFIGAQLRALLEHRRMHEA